jgi:phosphoenolpyruvate synthase/pyruvate phosphate dikinase
VVIVHHPSEASRVPEGAILVARAVDPGWTPIFGKVAGIVLELGSRLSHGAVVAREYGLPAVVNLDGITGVLTEGQIVTVDGTRGIVWTHDSGS